LFDEVKKRSLPKDIYGNDITYTSVKKAFN